MYDRVCIIGFSKTLIFLILCLFIITLGYVSYQCNKIDCFEKWEGSDVYATFTLMEGCVVEIEDETHN